ncbi:hypothetical protein F5X68DRAFT_188595 [Plectosphaerella plurivora]|uniref:Uncharacterized protein n=1 Tax=Plectosphaerella plurivora TaxID=936078 RepID=A0A9P8VGV8_9PEZI|nr:hypothetical protein F5X68DRAFT_188595 [Plectosphaerella plurivora]
MKFFTAIVLAAAAVNAVALPEANPGFMDDHPNAKSALAPPPVCWKKVVPGCTGPKYNPYIWKRAASPEADAEAAACDAPGQPCWVVKRAAEAFSDVMGEDHLEARSPQKWDCKKPFQPCWKAKRTAEAFAEALASAQEDSSDFTASLNLERRFPEVETTVEARSPQNWDCKKPFQPCWKAKRAAEAEAEAACNMAGGPCAVVKRAAEAVNLVVRSPQRWDCQKPFQPCWKAKREVAKLQNFARYVLEDQE